MEELLSCLTRLQRLWSLFSLLPSRCTPDSSAEIVDELLSYLTLADYSMREELVLKTAVLAER